MPAREPCVYCRRREADDRFRPFCSERCKMADLGRWLNGNYSVAGQPVSETTAVGDDSLDDFSEDDADPHR